MPASLPLQLAKLILKYPQNHSHINLNSFLESIVFIFLKILFELKSKLSIEDTKLIHSGAKDIGKAVFNIF